MIMLSFTKWINVEFFYEKYKIQLNKNIKNIATLAAI